MRDSHGWSASPFSESDSDPLTGFANIMDVLLVFALGVILAFIAQSRELQEHFEIADREVIVDVGEELAEAPESVRGVLDGSADGLQSMGEVYLDPETGPGEKAFSQTV